jgi:hypothetical protein
MKTPLFRLAALSLAVAVTAGCVSSTVIRSQPSGAKLYLDGESVGKTPYTMSDTKIVGSGTRVKLVAEGFEPFEAILYRNEVFDAGACLGGVLVLFPFLWIQGYKPDHNYELTPLRAPAPPPAAPAPAAPPRS